MTVCVAALCREKDGGVYAVGAADRMLSVQTRGSAFEPTTPKITKLSSAIGIMWAGDASFCREVLANVVRTVGDRIQKEPQNWWTVADVAKACQHHYNAARWDRAVQSILAPRGYDIDSFRQAQASLPDGLGLSIDNELRNFSDTPALEFLVVGLDTLDAHLYVVDNGDIRCHDHEGFCAIGHGHIQAESHFIVSAYGPITNVADAILHTFFAKKSAEGTLGVGRDATDMFSVGPHLGTFEHFDPSDIRELEKIYRDRVAAERRATQRAGRKIDVLATGMRKRRLLAQSTLESPDPGPPK